VSRVVVIGAGFAGLASAISLAVRGHTVTVLEARADPGGKARACDVGGAHVDLGPTILVDLAPLSELCAVAGVSLEQTVAVQRLDPGLVARFPEGELAFSAEPARLAADVACLGPDAARDWDSLLVLGARAARLADHFNRRGDIRDARDWLGFLMGGRLALGDVAPFVRYPSLAALLKRFIRTSSLRALLGHFARFIGLEATAAPSVALVIPYLLATGGVWYPRGGFSAMVQSLVRLAGKHGVALEMGDAVEGVTVYGGRAREIRSVAGRRYPAEAVVAAVDVRITARWLGGDLARRVVRLKPAFGARVAWWLVEGTPARPTHHGLYLEARGDCEPLYVAVPTVSDAALAPPGHSIVYTLLHATPEPAPSPALAGQMRARLAAAGGWPEGRVVSSGLTGGEESCYGYAIGPGLWRSCRVSPRLRDVGNVVLAGGSVFPGPGVANVIRSGLRAAELVEEVLAGGRS
jgi:phytoene dehydrogenase-like protein